MLTGARDLRADGHVFEGTTSVALGEIAECVADVWSARRHRVSSLPRNNGFRIQATPDGLGSAVILALDIEDKGAERTVRLYRPKLTFSAAGRTEKRIAEVEDCIHVEP